MVESSAGTSKGPDILRYRFLVKEAKKNDDGTTYVALESSPPTPPQSVALTLENTVSGDSWLQAGKSVIVSFEKSAI